MAEDGQLELGQLGARPRRARRRVAREPRGWPRARPRTAARRYSAVASSTHRRSRSGATRTSRSASATNAASSPSLRCASTRASSSSILVEALRLHDGRESTTPGQRGVPRQAPGAFGGIERACRIIVEVTAGGCREPLEALDVDGVGVDAQGVRARRRGDRVASDRGAPGRSTPAAASARCRRLVAPDASASSSVVTGRSARSTSAESTERSLGLSVTPSSERAEHHHAHAPHCSPFEPPVNDSRIPRIPTTYRRRTLRIPCRLNTAITVRE